MQAKTVYSLRAAHFIPARARPLLAVLALGVFLGVSVAAADEIMWADTPAQMQLPEARPVFSLEHVVTAKAQTRVKDITPTTLPQKRPADMTSAAVMAAITPAAGEEAPPVSFSRVSVVRRQAYLIDSVLEQKESIYTSGPSAERGNLYRQIFEAQAAGDFKQADVLMQSMADKSLLGHILADRYLHPSYKASYAQLADWLRNYADQPPASRIYALAQKRKKKGDAVALTAPRVPPGLPGLHDADVGQFPGPLRADGTLRQDVARSEEAARLFYDGKTTAALQRASGAALRSGGDVPLSAWISGLAAWKQASYKDAARYFEIVATANRATPWMSSAGAYWAARSYLRARQPQRVSHWLIEAARHPRTFYGIIALKALGQEQDEFNWDLPKLTSDHTRRLSSIPAGRRAVALIAAGRADMAEAELQQIRPASSDRDLQEAMLALSANMMPSLSMRMGSLFRTKDGDMYDAALYPDAPWQPMRGFKVDRALVYAFIRQESKFQVGAENRSSGARGLMQLMPATARHVASGLEYGVDARRLSDPVVNIDLGQRYIDELLNKSYVDQNLFKLAVAYNAGPAKLLRWQQSVSYEDDPLLFIESIPAAETRIFVERVLTNYWIYRLKYDQDTPSLDAVAGGDWPVYASQDQELLPRVAFAEQLVGVPR